MCFTLLNRIVGLERSSLLLSALCKVTEWIQMEMSEVMYQPGTIHSRAIMDWLYSPYSNIQATQSENNRMYIVRR